LSYSDPALSITSGISFIGQKSGDLFKEGFSPAPILGSQAPTGHLEHAGLDFFVISLLL
jgi:hypothetical protein